MGSLVPEPYPRTAAALIPRRRWRAGGGGRREEGWGEDARKKIARGEADGESRSGAHLYTQRWEICQLLGDRELGWGIIGDYSFGLLKKKNEEEK